VTPKPLIWTDRALRDLEEIDAYIAADDPIAAEHWVGVLLAAAQRAGELPMSGRKVPELGREDPLHGDGCPFGRPRARGPVEFMQRIPARTDNWM
jgi:plasmid stabilization system protein ParE